MTVGTVIVENYLAIVNGLSTIVNGLSTISQLYVLLSHEYTIYWEVFFLPKSWKNVNEM